MNIETLVKLGELGPVVIVALAVLIGFLVLAWFLVVVLPRLQAQGLHAVDAAVITMRDSVSQTRESVEEQRKMREAMSENQVREHARAEQRHAEVMTLLERQHTQSLAAIQGLRTDFLSESPDAERKK